MVGYFIIALLEVYAKSGKRILKIGQHLAKLDTSFVPDMVHILVQ